MKILGIALLIFGLSALVQSFRKRDSMAEIMHRGHEANELGSILWMARLMGIAAILGGAYLVGWLTIGG